MTKSPVLYNVTSSVVPEYASYGSVSTNYCTRDQKRSHVATSSPNRTGGMPRFRRLLLLGGCGISSTGMGASGPALMSFPVATGRGGSTTTLGDGSTAASGVATAASGAAVSERCCSWSKCANVEASSVPLTISAELWPSCKMKRATSGSWPGRWYQRHSSVSNAVVKGFRSCLPIIAERALCASSMWHRAICK